MSPRDFSIAKAEDVTKSGGSAIVGAAEIYMGCGDSKLGSAGRLLSIQERSREIGYWKSVNLRS